MLVGPTQKARHSLHGRKIATLIVLFLSPKLVLIPLGRDYYVFHPCFSAERYNADPCKLTNLYLGDEYRVVGKLSQTVDSNDFAYSCSWT